MLDIVHITIEPSFIFGGVGTYIKELSKQQQKNGQKVKIVFLDGIQIPVLHSLKPSKPFSNLFYRLIKTTYDLVPIFLREKLKLFKVQQNFFAIRQEITPNTIIHMHNPLLVKKILPILPFKNRTLLTVHGYYAFESLSDDDVKAHSPKLDKMLQKEVNAYTRVSCNLAVDERIAQHIHSYAPQARVCMHPNFVNEDYFLPVPLQERQRLRGELNIPQDRIVFLTTRRFEKKNGIPVFAQAISLLPQASAKKATFLLIGNGGEFPLVEKIIKKTTADVRLFGGVHHSEIKKYYNASDSFVIPSISVQGVEEATSISALEAMACGNLVIASNIGGLKMLIQDGINGLLVQDNNPQILAKIIEKVIENFPDLKTLKVAARQTIIDKFSLKKYVAFIEKLYLSLNTPNFL